MPNEKPFVIKKYANRRLYDTQSSGYVTLQDLARVTREGIDFQVLDAKTGKDITHQVLAQVIREEETHGEQMLLPISFLRQLIAMQGDSMQSMMPHYLEATMDNFRANRSKLQEFWEASTGPEGLAQFAEHNMKMFQAAASAFIPGAKPAEPPAPKPAASGDDLDALREQMAEMQRRLDAHGIAKE